LIIQLLWLTTQGKSSDSQDEVVITVYADLNCPYCYALNERLVAIGVAESVIWLPVEHAPDLYKHSFTDIDKQELIHEVDDVQSKAPEVTINVPATRPNSCHSSKLLTTIMGRFPDKATEFRTAVYRALWQNGDDISDPQILSRLLLSIGLSDLEIAVDAEKQLLTWHTAWEQGQFARNIPSLESNHGFKLLGFPPFEQLEQFIKLGTAKVTDFKDASCVSSDRYSIAVLSETDENWIQPGLLEAVSRYSFYPTIEALSTGVSKLNKLDMIVLNNPKENIIEKIKTLKDSLFTQYAPIFLLASDKNVQLNAYRAGVADIVIGDINEEILGHKMLRILRTKRSGDKLYEIARIDFLTGLYNRREFDAALEKEWRQQRREQNHLSLLMIDLDSFKLFNDTYGHTMGDDVLRRFAKILESCINRPTDLAVRYGGEEFAVILPNADIKGATHVAELIREQTEIHDMRHSASLVKSHVTVSIGVAEVGSNSDVSITELVDNADRALYKAKENGRNQVYAHS